MPDPESVVTINPWRQCEIELTAAEDHSDPYNTVDVWADFVSETGERLRRPAFWDGERTWRIRLRVAHRWQKMDMVDVRVRC